mmetsp:Transcript_317/g.611  ORF Transcript_317/g.611 Transcript_317/m.611 type:complete len:250 (-) Transcript_317:806-1555(-)
MTTRRSAQLRWIIRLPSSCSRITHYNQRTHSPQHLRFYHDEVNIRRHSRHHPLDRTIVRLLLIPSIDTAARRIHAGRVDSIFLFRSQLIQRQRRSPKTPRQSQTTPRGSGRHVRKNGRANGSGSRPGERVRARTSGGRGKSAKGTRRTKRHGPEERRADPSGAGRRTVSNTAGGIGGGTRVRRRDRTADGAIRAVGGRGGDDGRAQRFSGGDGADVSRERTAVGRSASERSEGVFEECVEGRERNGIRR